MKLSCIIKGIDIKHISDASDIEICDIVYDSRKVKKGCIFVCLKGSNADGHNFINQAILNGASVIVSENMVNIKNAILIVVENTRACLAKMSNNYFKNPSSELCTIGITGTKGKTTVSCMIRSIIESSGKKTGLIGTLGVVIGNSVFKMDNTTPESYEINKYLRKMVDDGCQYAVIEASSIGLKEHRLDGIRFNYGIFTNFSKDHIGSNEHKDMQEYLQCKSMLFKKCDLGILNQDDSAFEKIIQGHTCSIKTFGLSKNSDVSASDIELVSESGYIGVGFNINGMLKLKVKVPIPGKFSVYNALAAATMCYCEGFSEKNIKEGLDKVQVKGRVEPVKVPGKFTLLIDYAHNALSMKNILTTLREYKPNRLITMFGAGGNRARDRRFEMGEISGTLSDLSVITEDNSRFENVLDIIEDIKSGLNKTNGKYVVIPNRRDAIKYCIENAKDGDIIVLAGKGHEDYQETKGIKYPFDERVVISEILSEIKN